jgi:hypothetical protein
LLCSNLSDVPSNLSDVPSNLSVFPSNFSVFQVIYLNFHVFKVLFNGTPLGQIAEARRHIDESSSHSDHGKLKF